MKTKLQQGMIVWVWVIPRRGNPKHRPAVLLTPTELIDQARELLVMGISTSYYPDNEGAIQLPYDKDGRSKTRLTRDSAACADLLQFVDKKDIEWRGGWVPVEYLAEVLEVAKNIPGN